MRLYFVMDKSGALPFAGGSAEQPCQLMDAFDIVAATAHALARKRGDE